MTEDALDDDDDIYKDLDLVLSPKATAKCDDGAQIETDSWMDYADVLMLQNPTVTLTSRLESERKKLEMDLLLEFVSNEGSSRKSKLKMDPEFQELQKEVLRLQNLNSEKDAQISELTTQNINLKKNISSLYKTAKSEVEQKDLLLADANRRLEKTFFRYNRLNYTRDQCSQTVNPSSDNPEEPITMKLKEGIADSNESDLKHQSASITRKRLLSPDKEETNKGYEKRTRVKQSRMEKCDSVASTSSVDCKEQSVEHASTTSTNSKEQSVEHALTTSNNCKEQSVEQALTTSLSNNCKEQLVEHAPATSTSNDCTEQLIEQSPVSSRELSSSQDTDVTTDAFFNLLPDTVKHSFLEYELCQIESLNRLKQSFIDHYFMQSKDRSHGLDNVQVTSEPDLESPGSLVTEPCIAKASSSSSMKETDDLNSAKEKMPVLPANCENHENPKNKRTKPLDANASSIEVSSDLNGSKENIVLSPVKQTDKANLTSKETQNAKEFGNKSQKHSSSKAINLSEAYQCDIVKLYRQRKEKIPILLKRQIYNYHKQVKDN